MTHNMYVYIFITGAVSYLIRVLPLTLIRKPIENKFLQSFLYYVPYVTLAVMAFPAIITATETPISGVAAFIVAVLVAWIDGNLFKVAVASCIAVYITELIALH